MGSQVSIWLCPPPQNTTSTERGEAIRDEARDSPTAVPNNPSDNQARRSINRNMLLLSSVIAPNARGWPKRKKVDWNGDTLQHITQRYVLDGWNTAKGEAVGNENWDVYLDLDASNGLETRYLRGDVVDELFARVDQGTTPRAYWTLLDHQGSVRDVLDEGGVLKASARYDGYGNVTERTTGVGDPLPEEDFGYLGRYGWTGRERDAETGLQHNRARYYDPRTGRWLSLDPLGFAAGDANLYRYVGNAPTVATDPSGLVEKEPTQIVIPVADLAKTLKRIDDSDPIKKGGSKMLEDRKTTSPASNQVLAHTIAGLSKVTTPAAIIYTKSNPDDVWFSILWAQLFYLDKYNGPIIQKFDIQQEWVPSDGSKSDVLNFTQVELF